MILMHEYVYKPTEQKRKTEDNLNASGNFIYKRGNISKV